MKNLLENIGVLFVGACVVLGHIVAIGLLALIVGGAAAALVKIITKFIQW